MILIKTHFITCRAHYYFIRWNKGLRKCNYHSSFYQQWYVGVTLHFVVNQIPQTEITIPSDVNVVVRIISFPPHLHQSDSKPFSEHNNRAPHRPLNTQSHGKGVEMEVVNASQTKGNTSNSSCSCRWATKVNHRIIFEWNRIEWSSPCDNPLIMILRPQKFGRYNLYTLVWKW